MTMATTGLTKTPRTPQAPPPGTDALAVESLSIEYRSGRGWARVVDDLSFRIKPGRTLGLVGESGCGKSTTALAVMDLLPRGGSRVATGSVTIAGADLYAQDARTRRQMRGTSMAMIFQEPMSSLNPAFTIGEQIAESVRVRLGLSRRQAWARAVEALDMVEIPRPAQRAKEYPFAFSGGMLQRSMIALALSCRPSLLIADEPTTALDVTIQDQVLKLLEKLQDELGMAMLFITHDLSVMADICDDLVVMYAGQSIETSSVDEFLAGPRHPYARGLIGAMPQLIGTRDRLTIIPGRVPAPGAMPEGCRFHPRCSFAEDRCRTVEPALEPVTPTHADRCLRSEEIRVRND